MGKNAVFTALRLIKFKRLVSRVLFRDFAKFSLRRLYA